MRREPASRQETNTERASRARDNKRRHRARQKEYVQDLERQVAETREQGVRVTKEVQLAAQKVTRENAKLRDLLRRTGYTDDAIDAWVKEEECTHGAERPQLVLRLTSGEIMQRGVSACEQQKRRKLEAQSVSLKKGEPVPMKTSQSGECSTEVSPPSESCNKSPNMLPTDASAVVCKKSSSPAGCPDVAVAPCKLVTLLAENPALDPTQVPLLTESSNQSYNISKLDDRSSDGIECSDAYNMLMRYATSSEKMDRIAVALESGCTPSAAGGCKVKKSVVWKTLDEECS